MHFSNISILLIQIMLILGLSRLMGSIALRFRQPKVVGEMLAGIMLGPSLLGWIAPGFSAFIFPADGVQLLNVLAQIGVILFLFLIGLELDPKLLRNRGHAALIISHVSIVAPFILGALVALLLYSQVFNHAPHMRFVAVALFMGAAMSITAFPVLARILTERGLHKTKVGAVAITCAAVDDISAWCMLAFVVAVGRAEGLWPGLMTAGLSLTYVAGMLFVVRPILNRLESIYERRSGSSQTVFAVVLVLTLLSAATTEIIGIHALFGAFLMGVIMPKNAQFARLITSRLEDFTIIFLLPVFFAYAGLKTQIGLLDSPGLWAMTALLILAASVGKFGGSTIAAKVTGMNWRESLAIGTLMNTRGLVELVILTIGLQIGVITDAVFAMMVIMALFTTAMTTPILHWIYPQRMFDADPVDDQTAASEFGIVIPVSRPESAPNLARVAASLGRPDMKVKVYGVNFRAPLRNDTLGINVHAEDSFGETALRPLAEAANAQSVPSEMVAMVSRDVPSDIARIARAKKADLVLMGFHKPIIGRAILGGTVHRVLTGADADVAILVDRGIQWPLKIMVPYQGSSHDRLALEMASRMATAPGTSVTILHVVPPGKDSKTNESVRSQNFPGSVEVRLIEGQSPIDTILEQSNEFGLVIVGMSEEWGLASHLFGLRAERLADEWPGSLLLVRKYTSIESQLTKPAAPASV